MTTLTWAAIATTPGTSLASAARRSAVSIWGVWAAPPCAAARRMTVPTEAVAVSAAVVLRNSRRVCDLMIMTFPLSSDIPRIPGLLSAIFRLIEAHRYEFRPQQPRSQPIVRVACLGRPELVLFAFIQAHL